VVVLLVDCTPDMVEVTLVAVTMDIITTIIIDMGAEAEAEAEVLMIATR